MIVPTKNPSFSMSVRLPAERHCAINRHRCTANVQAQKKARPKACLEFILCAKLTYEVSREFQLEVQLRQKEEHRRLLSSSFSKRLSKR